MARKIELNRRRALGGIATVGIGLAAAGAGTFALFSDTESSTSNEVTAGTLDLQSASDGVISVTNAVPGQSLPGSGTYTIQTTYDSGSSVDPAEVDLSVTNSEPGSEPTEPSNSTDQTASAFAQQLTVTTANTLKNGAVVDDLTSTHGVSTADDLGGLSIDAAYGGVSPGDTLALELAMTFDSTAGNDYQADGVTMAVSFTAEQPSAD